MEVKITTHGKKKKNKTSSEGKLKCKWRSHLTTVSYGYNSWTAAAGSSEGEAPVLGQAVEVLDGQSAVGAELAAPPLASPFSLFFP